MNKLHCALSADCRQYCSALHAAGVPIEYDQYGCDAPGMFTIDRGGVTFSPREAYSAAWNSELVGSLGKALCDVLVERDKSSHELANVERIITDFNRVHDARCNLWRHMLDTPRNNRRFTDVELAYYTDEIAEAEAVRNKTASENNPQAVVQAQAAFDHMTLDRDGVLFDDQMIQTVNRLVSNIVCGQPTLLVGDKGVAKTQAAKFAVSLWEPGREPVVISGHGDMMSNELIGQVEQDAESKLFEYKEGKLVQAMREGRPVILDEVNVGDQAILMRLQDILLRRPGQRIIIQENGGESIEIQPGFVVIATANEASARYQHRSMLDPAFRDRFDTWPVLYPDSSSTSPLQHMPANLMRLALAAAVDERGVLSRHINPAVLERLVRLAHVTQHLYSVPAKNARVSTSEGSETTSSLLVDEPTMTNCVTPRALVGVIRRCVAGNLPDTSLEGELEHLIRGLDQAGSKHNETHARRILALLGK